MNNWKARKTVLFLGCITLLLGCSNLEKNEFVSQCKTQQKSEANCECTYDFAKKSLDTDNQFEFFVASFLQDKKRLANAQASLGMMELITTGSKVVWILANLDAACMENIE